MYTALNFEAETLKDLAHKMAEYYWDCQSEPTIDEIAFQDNEGNESYLSLKRTRLFEGLVHYLILKNRDQEVESQQWKKHCNSYRR